MSLLNTAKGWKHYRRLLAERKKRRKRHVFLRKAVKWWPGKYPGDRQSKEYYQWRLAVLQRDGWKCQQCGKVGQGLHAHHILGFEHYPDLRFEVNNGIMLCEQCHLAVHEGTTKLNCA